MEEKKEKTLYKKWWFWTIILVVVIIISFSVIVLIGFNIINPDENLTKLTIDLQNYDNNIVIYQSAEKNTILIEGKTKTSEEAVEKSNDIGKIIGKYIEYLSVYDDIKFDFYTEEGEKTTFTYDIETKETKEETIESWLLEDSVAYDEKQKELEEIETKKNELNTEIVTLEDKKETLNLEIEQLNGEVVKLKGEPKTYPAGHLEAGTDIPIGKYKIYDGNSNFVVYSSTGKLKVNIILGTGNYNVKEYIYTFENGDKIEASSSFKLVEVE